METMETIFAELAIWDILGSSSVDHKPKNILLASVTSINFSEDPLTVNFQQWRPEGWSTSELRGSKLDIPKDEILNSDLVLQWDRNLPLPPTWQKIWLFDVVELFPCDVADFHFNQQSTWIPCDRVGSTLPQLNHLEVFAGGFGGWKAAASWMRAQGFFNSCTLAIECDQQLAKIYALSHSAVCVKSIEGLAYHTFQYANQDAIIVADILHNGLLPLIAYWKPEIMSISSPCQPFSGASTTKGILTEKGFLLIRALICAKFWRPNVLFLEQVHNFAKHPHKKVFDRILFWAGYQYCFQKVINLADKAPTARPRWIAVAKRIYGDFNSKTFVPWNPSPDLTPDNCKTILSWDAETTAELNITEEIRRIASDPKYAFKKPDSLLPRHCILASRVFESHQKIPTFMAMYGRQHKMDPDRLSQFGFFGHYLKDDKQCVRHWHPAEVALIHGISHFPFLPNDKHVAWMLLGNQISGLQALVPWIYFAQCTESTSLSIEQLANQFREDHLKGNNVTITSIDDGYFLHHDSQSFEDDSLDCICLLKEWMDATLSTSPKAWIPNVGLMDFSDIMLVWSTTAEMQKESSNLFYLSNLNINQDETSLDDAPEAIDRVDSTKDHGVSDMPSQIPSTIRFHPLMKGCIQGSINFEFWYDATIDSAALKDVWPGYEIVEVSPIQSDGISLRLVVQLGEIDLTLQQCPSTPIVALLNDGMVTLLPCSSDIASVVEPLCGNQLFDQFGPLVKEDFQKALALYANCDVTQTCQNPFAVYHVNSMNRCNRNITWLPETQEIRMTFTGEIDATSAQAGFWCKLLSEASLKFLGIDLTLTELPQGYQIAWKPATRATMLPTRAFAIQLAVNAFRQLLPSFDTHETREVIVKWMNKIIWKGKLANSITMQLLASILGMATWPLYGCAEFLFVQSGRRLDSTQQVSQCMPLDADAPIVLHAIQSSRGGGPATTTKSGHRTQIANSIASTLLQEGYELQWVSTSVDKLIELQGPKNLSTVVATPPGPTRMQGIVKAFFSQFNNFRYGLCVFALRVVSFSCCFAQLLPPCIRSCSPFLGFGPPMTSASGPTSHVQTEEACDGSFESWLLGLLSPCLPSPCLFFYVFLYLRFSFSDSLPKWHKVSA